MAEVVFMRQMSAIAVRVKMLLFFLWWVELEVGGKMFQLGSVERGEAFQSLESGRIVRTDRQEIFRNSPDFYRRGWSSLTDGSISRSSS